MDSTPTVRRAPARAEKRRRYNAAGNTSGSAMQFVVKYSQEITIKSRRVRVRLCKRLESNIRERLKHAGLPSRVQQGWDRLLVEPRQPGAATLKDTLQQLCDTPGVANIQRVRCTPYRSFAETYSELAEIYLPLLANRSFAVRCKRTGTHDFGSAELERYLGACLLRDAENARVQLKNPDITVRVEVKDDQLYLVEHWQQGLGGFPAGALDPALSLVSGGFDSGVATYMALRRGLKTHVLFFRLGGAEHEAAVQQLAVYLWLRYAPSQRLKFVSVPFENVVEEIQRKVDRRHVAVVLKRQMMQAADYFCEQMRIDFLVTGESLAQVASQTARNIAVIDKATDRVVLRPLAMIDKDDIIRIAERIGTEALSRDVPEYCGAVAHNPRTRARLDRVEYEEAQLDDAVLQQALADTRICFLDELQPSEQAEAVPAATTVKELPQGATVLDIRHPVEQEGAPLSVDGATVIAMPFYELSRRMPSLDQSKVFYLYCDKGIMSRLQAQRLHEAGFTNTRIFLADAGLSR